MLNQALLSGDLEDLINFEVAEALDVDWATLLVGFVVEVRVYSLDLIVLFKVEHL